MVTLSGNGCLKVLQWRFATWVLMCASSGASAVPLTLEQINAHDSPECLTASDTQIAWVGNDAGRRNVWIADAPTYAARRLTTYAQDDGQEITSLSLSPDGAWMVFVRGGDHGGNWLRDQPVNPRQFSAPQEVAIWSIATTGGVARKLAVADYPTITPDGRSVLFSLEEALWSVPIDGSAQPRRVFGVRGGVGSLTWSPDGQRLAFVSSRGTHSFIGVYDAARDSVRWIAPATARDGSPRWSSDGRRLAFVRRPSDLQIPHPGPARAWTAYNFYKREFEPRPWSIWVADVETGEAARIWASGSALKDAYLGDFLEWGDEDRLLFMSYQDGWRHLYSVSAGGGRPLLLTPGAYSVEDASLLDRRHVIFSANTGPDPSDIDRRHLFVSPLDRGTPQAVTSGTGSEWQPVPMAQDRIAFLAATAQRPPTPMWLDLANKSPQVVMQDWIRAYPVEKLVVPQKVSFPAPDGQTVHGQLFLPRVVQKGSKNRPAVVYVHGGPGPQQLLGWHRFRYFSEHYALNQYLASRGFVVLSVNYRTDESYGHAFNYPLDAGPRGASEYQDIQAAGRYLQSRPEVDGEHIGIYGSSYGGYLTALALARDSGLFRAGVDIHGVHDWIVQFDLNDLFSKLPFDDPSDAKHLLEVAWRSSPVSSVSSWRSPVLLVSGDDDHNVAFAQTLDLTRRLESAGVPHETLVLPDETHFMLSYSHALKVQHATAEFLERFLMKEPQ